MSVVVLAPALVTFARSDLFRVEATEEAGPDPSITDGEGLDGEGDGEPSTIVPTTEVEAAEPTVETTVPAGERAPGPASLDPRPGPFDRPAAAPAAPGPTDPIRPAADERGDQAPATSDRTPTSPDRPDRPDPGVPDPGSLGDSDDADSDEADSPTDVIRPDPVAVGAEPGLVVAPAPTDPTASSGPAGGPTTTGSPTTPSTARVTTERLTTSVPPTDATTTTTTPPSTTRPPTSEAPTTPPPATEPPCRSPQWELVLDEQFAGGALDRGTWRTLSGAGNDGNGLRRRAALTVASGELVVTAHMRGANLLSGAIEHRHSQTYGRYEFRVRIEQDPSETMAGLVATTPASGNQVEDGYHALWEVAASPGTRPEFWSSLQSPDGERVALVHPTTATSWHTMVLEWGPDSLRLLRDGVVVRTVTETSADLIPDEPHRLTISLDALAADLPAPVEMKVDYVKVWSYAGC